MSCRRGIRFAIAIGLGLGVLPAQGQVNWPVSFDASTAQLTAQERSQLSSHFQEAGRRWAAVTDVSGPRSIEIEFVVSTAIARATGGSVTSGFVTRIGMRDTFEQGAAAELRTGTDPNAGDPDVRITINPTYLRDELWFDPDPVARTATVPLDRTDAMSVALHELGHALAYNGWADLNTGVPPDTFWSTFDQHFVPGAPSRFNGPFAVATFGTQPDLTTGNNKHWGNASTIKRLPHWREPIRFENGVPVPQLHCETPPSVDLPAGQRTKALAQGGPLLDELMNGVRFFRGFRYDIGSLDLAALRDVGLPVQEVLFENGYED
jgi:hypothetical protein